jgi:hypothetical protein
VSPRVGSEAESGNVAIARDTDREPTRPRLAVAPKLELPTKTPTPVDRIGKLTAAELQELSPPEARGVQSGAYSKRFGQATLDWSALRTPTPIPPPPAAEHVTVPSAVQPFYGRLPDASERAELHITDLSLELANPFVGSSLNPPPTKQRPWLRPFLITIGGCVLIGSGYAGAVYHVERQFASTMAKWTGAEVAPATIAIVPDAPLQAATAPSAPAAEHFAQTAEAERVHVEQPAAAPAGEAAHIATAGADVAASAVTSESRIDAAPTQQLTAAPAATTAAESSAIAGTPRARRRAAREAAARVEAAQESAKAVEEVKPEVATPAAPAAPVMRPVLAPNPYVTRSATSAATAAPAAAPIARTAAPATQGPVPQTLTRTQVQAALESMRDQLQTCAAGAHGRMKANVTISGAGRVTYATIEGAFAGTPQGSCMARALRGTQFPQFASPLLRVGYPFAL